MEIPDKEELANRLGGEPILHSIRKKEYWESVLETLAATIKPNDQTATIENRGRIVYTVGDHELMDIHLQCLLKSGAWSAGTHVSLQKFMHKEVKNMDDSDRKVADAMYRDDDYQPHPKRLEL